MKKFYTSLMKEVEEQGELSLFSRKELWKIFDSEPESAKEKRVQLELNCLQKVMDSWKEDEPISAELQDTSKDGSYCTECGKFSNHIESSTLGSESLGKMKGWTVEFGLIEPIYYCDNPECSKESFFPASEVWHIERVVHFSYLMSIPEIQEKICALFDIQ